MPEETTMDQKHARGATEQVKLAANDTTGKVTRDKQLRAEVKFDKAQGSSRNDVADMRDVAREASEKSQ
jgi:uncharacterized protein YjbJ (UPF0337 family)